MDKIEEKIDLLFKELTDIKTMLNNQNDEVNEPFVDTSVICEKLNLSKEAVRKYRFKKIIPFYKLNGKVLFKMSEVIDSINHYKINYLNRYINGSIRSK